MPSTKQPPLIQKIDKLAKEVQKTANAKEPPAMSFPIRALQNVTYDERQGFQDREQGEEKDAFVNTIKTSRRRCE
jgi:DNA topoisomerase VI subunit A